jgi:hypothetical protein
MYLSQELIPVVFEDITSVIFEWITNSKSTFHAVTLLTILVTLAFSNQWV